MFFLYLQVAVCIEHEEVPRLRDILKDMLKRGKSPKSIVKLLVAAASGVYKMRGK